MANPSPAIDLEKARKVLSGLDAGERIKWMSSKVSQGIVATTSGGETSRILPHLIEKALDKTIPIIFIDTGHYSDETYLFVDKMQKDGVDIRYYTSEMSSKRMQALYGKLWESQGEDFDKFLDITKHKPLNRAFRQLNASLWIRGLMGFKTNERSKIPILEYKNGLYRLYPMIDWTHAQACQYLKSHNLPANPVHHDLTKGPSGKQECKMGDKGGFVDGEGI
tara:strand:- start:1172 stop:1837 length:666 start_codon:yes stop_codon:yes gene_type:complete